LLPSTLDLDEVLSLVVDRLVRVYPGASGAILLREEGEDRERSRSGELQRTATHAAHRAIAERRPIVAFDHIAMPLIANDRLLGAVVLQVPDYKEFLEEEVRFVGALANQAALAIDKASLYALERKTTESLRELERARADQPLFVRGDKRRTAEVVAGLVHNATKYAPEGTRIAVRIEGADDRAIVRVRDEGPGVPPQDRARIFEPYARGVAHDDIAGSGIGLFAARRVVEGQGGDLWLEDAPGGGAVFAF